MSNEKFFLEDIDVPEVVQKKVDLAFSIIKKDGEKNMKKEKNNYRKICVKTFTAAAACAVIIAGIALGKAFIKEPDTQVAQESESVITQIDKMFTMQVQAAPLTPGQQVPVVFMKDGEGWVFGGNENGTDVNYCISTPFTCEGENISSITYSINQGAFQIVGPTNDSIVTDGILYEGELNTGIIGGFDTPEGGEELNTVNNYKAFTVDYDRQSDENTWINICNIIPMSAEDQELVFGDVNNLEQYAAGCAKMVENVVITCTVQFTDGTSQDMNITMGSKIMTYAEAGQKAENPEEKSVFMTFELQE